MYERFRPKGSQKGPQNSLKYSTLEATNQDSSEVGGQMSWGGGKRGQWMAMDRKAMFYRSCDILKCQLVIQNTSFSMKS